MFSHFTTPGAVAAAEIHGERGGMEAGMLAPFPLVLKQKGAHSSALPALHYIIEVQSRPGWS